ncbi:MAG: radical SAM protein [Candidatus Omnitrophota bacterium]
MQNFAIKFLYELLKVKITGKAKPLLATFSLTARCNCSCEYCDLLSKGTSQELSTAEIMDIIAELRQSGTMYIHFSGGEPLLRTDFEEITGYAKSLGMIVSCSTNAVMLAERVPELKKNIDKININFDGTEQVCERIKGKGAYKKIIFALEALRNSGIKTVLSVVLTKFNTNNTCLEHILNIAEEYSTNVIFQPAINFSDGTPSAIAPEPKDYQEFLKEVLRKKMSGQKQRILNSVVGLKYLQFWPSEDVKLNCPAGKIYCRIRSDGALSLCGLKSGKFFLKKNISKDEMPDDLKKLQIFKEFCPFCWCAVRVELSQIWGLSLGSMINTYQCQSKK